ncbi:ATP-binding protein [Humibacillus xanthopallidus]|uniref:Phage shock protein C (PspC) family protein n=1 Tax=Humibacillus xanthopallidus TaxID=412689 RepID=A0A543I0V3_9MICO|nr:ATP-binding protein [Humibacillus xanthopallidus]TQM64140.1 phage shock protein C (PspC) family protein [Humibacillus xanthopallidus]
MQQSQQPRPHPQPPAQTPPQPPLQPASGPLPAWRAKPRPPLVRHRSDKVLAGVAAGLAAHLGLPVGWVRVAFVASSIPFGAGIVVYIFLWATMREEGSAATLSGMPPAPSAVTATVVPPTVATAAATAAAGTTAPGTTAGAVPGAPGEAAQSRAAAGATGSSSLSAHLHHGIDLTGLRSWLRNSNQAVVITLLGVAALVAASALWLGSVGFDVHAEVVVPVVAIVIGAIFFWSQLDDSSPLGGRRPVRWIWLVVGLGFTLLGLVALLVRGTNITELWQVLGAVLAALVGISVLCAPWILRLWTNLREEQTARIRATERADIAAHLHDSVLQTLALIQRQSTDSATVARLARAQERQLRSYLYDEDSRAGTLGAALTAAMGEVEDLQGVPVQLVVTGDRPMDSHLDALVKAVREAAWNAVRHASPPVSAYVEVGPDAVEAFVRDHGSGFDLDAVPDDRAGVRESIIGRMERHGGTARIRRRADGTEVELRLPVGGPDTAQDPTPTTSSPTPTPAPTPANEPQEQPS